jgi:signal transduction histidine kinase
MKITQQQDMKSLIKIVNHYNLEDLITFSKTVKVLYVAKDTALRDDYYGIFKIFFHEIDVASNGKEGLEYFQKNKYDLIIIALDIEKISSVELIEKIRKTSLHITILIISSEKKYFTDLIRLGIDGYILSPIEVQQFIRIIQKVIETLQNKQIVYEYQIELEKKNKELFELNTTLKENIKKEIKKNRDKDIKLFEQSKITSMADMLSNIAHQWRQPLNVISTAASAIEIEKKFQYLNDQNLHHFLHTINLATKHLSDLIDIFREFVKDDDIPKKIILQDWIIRILVIVQESLMEKHIQLINNIEKLLPIELIIKTGKLSQVLINIIKNSEEILTHRKSKDPWIKLDAEVSDKTFILTIEDNGGGIPKENFPKIFEPYFTTKHQSQGTGLGLYLSYKIILDNFKGKLYAKNTENGAKFFIEIPIDQNDLDL